MTSRSEPQALGAAEHVAQQLELTRQLDAAYGVYITRCDDEALETAHEIDRVVSRGESVGPLAGLTVAVKDLLGTRDMPTTAQSLVREEPWFGGEDAPVVARLRAAGAIITGKTSMAEHAAGRIDPAKPFPVPRNPWDQTRWPGGSSSGSAIAVALGLADAALGTDTSGSLRIPAAFCGITGFRPTTGLVDTAGCMPASESIDTVGPMARSARACAELLAVLAPETAVSASWRDRLVGVRVGVPRTMIDSWGDRLGPEIRVAFEEAVASLEKLGAEIVEIELAEWDALSLATMLLSATEMYARHETWLRTRWSDYGRSFRRIAALGALIPEASVQEVRDGLIDAKASLDATFTKVDVIATPTWAQPPTSYFASMEMSGEDLNLTAAWASAGVPCVATPMGLDSRGLPMSLQLAGRAGRDLHVLEIADCYERLAAPELPAIKVTSDVPAPIPDPDAGVTLLTGEALEQLTQMFAPLGLTPDAYDLVSISGMLRAMA